MYANGALILYGRTGVCRVESVTERRLPGEKQTAPYYLMRPLYQSGTIVAPVEKVEDGTLFSRPIMDREQAQAFIQALPTVPVEPYYNSNLKPAQGSLPPAASELFLSGYSPPASLHLREKTGGREAESKTWGAGSAVHG